MISPKHQLIIVGKDITLERTSCSTWFWGQNTAGIVSGGWVELAGYLPKSHGVPMQHTDISCEENRMTPKNKAPLHWRVKKNTLIITEEAANIGLEISVLCIQGFFLYALHTRFFRASDITSFREWLDMSCRGVRMHSFWGVLQRNFCPEVSTLRGFPCGRSESWSDMHQSTDSWCFKKKGESKHQPPWFI